MARSACNGFDNNRSCYQKLAANFATHGIPHQIVSDNDPGEKFKQFCLSRGIHHTTTAPYHPRSNGEIEQFVQTFKQSVDKAKVSSSEFQDCVLNFLAHYRASPHSVTDRTPSEMLNNRRMRTSYTPDSWMFRKLENARSRHMMFTLRKNTS